MEEWIVVQDSYNHRQYTGCVVISALIQVSGHMSAFFIEKFSVELFLPYFVFQGAGKQATKASKDDKVMLFYLSLLF